MPFFVASRETATNYLSTVLTVDDMLGFGPLTIVSDDDYLGEDEDDDEMSLIGIGRVEDTGTGTGGSIVDHYLDYQELSKSFASLGLHCCGLKPDTLKPIAEVVDEILKPAYKSDLCIFDWEMEAAKDGSTVKSVIEKIVINDCALGGRLRLIILYTGIPSAKHNEDIIVPLAGLIEGTLQQINKHTVRISGSYIDICDSEGNCSWRIICKGKSDVETNELPDIAINEFSELTAGLLSNATLAAIADIRINTNNLLYKFNKNLDFAFVSHVLGLMSSPDSRGNANNVSIDYAIDLVSEEIKSILQNSVLLKNEFKSEKMSYWPSFKNNNDTEKYLLAYGTNTRELTATQLLDIMNVANKGDSEYDTILSNIGISKSKFKNSPISLSLVGEDANSYLQQLSSIEGVRRSVCSYKEVVPVSLKQGTILELNGVIYVCIQPLCDSVRLKKDTDFVFLKSVSDCDKFTHVIKNKDKYIKLHLVPGKNGVHNFTFKPDIVRGEVISFLHDGEHYFNAEYNIDGISKLEMAFRWLGELKSHVAQSLATNLASQLSRVGLDTNEWLRSQ